MTFDVVSAEMRKLRGPCSVFACILGIYAAWLDSAGSC